MWRPLTISGLIATLAAGAMHLAFSAGAAFTMTSYKDRIFDVREFPHPSDFAPLVGGYVQALPASTVVAGSSFSFGYPLSADKTLASGLPDTVNASVVGGGFDLITETILCEIKARGLRPKAIVLEVPLINEVYNIGKNGVRPIACAETAHPSLLSFALGYPVGTQWFDLLTDPYSDTRDRSIQIQPVFQGYFVTREQFEAGKTTLRERMRATYLLGSESADAVYMFVTPVYIPGITDAGDDPQKVLEQFKFAEQACMEIAGSRCISTADMLDQRDFYSNITHINGVGAAFLRDLIGAALRPAGT